MNLTTIQILFFCLIPIGVFMLLKAIKLLQKVFNRKVVSEFAFAAKNAGFEITKNGTYSIWQKTKNAKLFPFNKCSVTIQNQLTKEPVMLSSSIAGPSANKGTMRRMKLFTFSAEAGNYTATLTNAPDSMEHGDNDKYFIQIRESKPDYCIPVAIVLIILSVACIIGGSILGIMADQLF